MRRLTCALVLAAFAAAPALAQEPRGWPAFARSFDSLAASDSVVGGAAVFVHHGRIVSHHEYGLADRPPGPLQRIDQNSIFHYGSITKTLTAIAIMQLRDRGRLSLDDKVTHYIPELRQVHNPYGSMDSITIRMLLSHSSGFQNPTWPYRKYVSWEPFEPTRWDQLLAMMPYQEIHFAPGSQFGYSNPAFIYLARIIEQLSGDAWQSYVYKNIWLPLGITHSYFAATPWTLLDQRSNNFTLVSDSGTNVEHVVANGRDFDPGITIPNGGWNAPLSDLAKWVAFLTGVTPNDAILSRASLQEMWRPVVPVGGPANESMGLSFFLRPLRGTTLVGHTGEQAGFRSFMYFNPGTTDAVIFVVNTTNDAHPNDSAARFNAIGAKAADLLVP